MALADTQERHNFWRSDSHFIERLFRSTELYLIDKLVPASVGDFNTLREIAWRIPWDSTHICIFIFSKCLRNLLQIERIVIIFENCLVFFIQINT